MLKAGDRIRTTKLVPYGDTDYEGAIGTISIDTVGIVVGIYNKHGQNGCRVDFDESDENKQDVLVLDYEMRPVSILELLAEASDEN